MRMKLGVALTNVGNATWKGSTFLIGHPRIRPKTEPWSITIEWPITEATFEHPSDETCERLLMARQRQSVRRTAGQTSAVRPARGCRLLPSKAHTSMHGDLTAID
jgi:hypothetical protein